MLCFLFVVVAQQQSTTCGSLKTAYKSSECCGKPTGTAAVFDGSCTCPPPPPPPPPASTPAPAPVHPPLHFGNPRCYTTFEDPDALADSTPHHEIERLGGWIRRNYTGTELHECGNYMHPTLAYVAHSSHIGMCEYDAHTGIQGSLPAHYHGTVLSASRGSWNRETWTGRRIDSFLLQTVQDSMPGRTRLAPQRFEILTPPTGPGVTDFELRPVDVIQAPNGVLLVTTDKCELHNGASCEGLYAISANHALANPILNWTDPVHGHFYMARLSDPINNLRMMASSHKYVYIGVGGYGGGMNVMVAKINDDYTATMKTLVTNLWGPQGVAYDASDGTLYIATINNAQTMIGRGRAVVYISAVDDIADALFAETEVTLYGSDSRVKLLNNTYSQTIDSGHPLSAVAVMPNGLVLVGVGAEANFQQTFQHGYVVAINKTTGNAYRFGSGSRNPVGFLHHKGHVLINDMGSDDAEGGVVGGVENAPNDDLWAVKLDQTLTEI